MVMSPNVDKEGTATRDRVIRAARDRSVPIAVLDALDHESSYTAVDYTAAIFRGFEPGRDFDVYFKKDLLPGRATDTILPLAPMPIRPRSYQFSVLPKDIDIFIERAGTRRRARQSKRAKTAYSVTCAHLRITTRMTQMVCGDIPGFNQSKNGTMNRDVCSGDIKLVEPTKITPSQTSSGSQYLRKRRIWFVGRLCQAPK